MSDQLIAELREQVKQARDDAAKKRKKVTALTADVARLTTDLASANQKVVDLDGKVGKTPPELQTRIDDLTAQLRDVKHKAAFKDVAIESGMRPNAIDTAWTALRLRADTDEPDAEAFRAAIDTARESHDFLFGSTVATTATIAGDTPPPPKPPIGGERGGRPGSGMFRVTFAQNADPAWCMANDKAMREAQANGTLQIVPG